MEIAGLSHDWRRIFRNVIEIPLMNGQKVVFTKDGAFMLRFH